jgi:CubicO group peptidase (beta-lactamase class C family)
MKKSILISLIILTTIFNCKSQYPTDKQKIIHDLDSIRRHYEIPAVNFGVATYDSLLLLGALGVRDINTKDTVTANDLFHFGSIGKGFTSFIAGRLIDEGLITWNTRFFDLFPEMKENSRKEYLDLDLKDLLSNRTFLQSLNKYPDNKTIIDGYNALYKNDRFSNYLFAKYALTLEPVKFESDQFYNYTSLGFLLASLMMEKSSGLPYSVLVEKINKDLDVNFIIGWPQDFSKNQPSGHLIPSEAGVADYDKLFVVNGDMYTGWYEGWLYYCIPSGHHSVSVVDFLKYLQLNLNGLAGQNNYLKASTYDFIFNGAKEYAMGWGNDIMENGNHYYSHSGSAGNYFAKAIILKESGVVITIMSNAGNGRTKGGLLPFESYLENIYSTADCCGQPR